MASNELPVVRMEFFGDPADGSVKLRMSDVSHALRTQGIALSDGLQIVVTDGDLFVNAMLIWKDGSWALVVC